MKKLNHLLSLLTCLLMMSAIALRRSGRLCGIAPTRLATATDAQLPPGFLTTLEDGTVVLDTTFAGAQVSGYAGPTPLKIYLKDNILQSIEALPNQETPEFFSATAEPGFREQWYGKTVEQAAATQVKPVTGATYSSTAFIRNVQLALDAYRQTTEGAAASPRHFWRPSLKFLAGMLVALAAAVLPFFLKGKPYRIVQLTANVLVLGCWCGACLSYAQLTRMLSHGLHEWEALLPLLLLAMAVIYPLFGRKSHYCMNACPFGSLQELAGKCTRRKLHLPTELLKWLDGFRQLLWALLMFLMWCGVAFDWMNNEPFAAFLFRNAPPVALTIAALFLLLSFFLPRPYCRFVCPTGSLLKLAESAK